MPFYTFDKFLPHFHQSAAVAKLILAIAITNNHSTDRNLFETVLTTINPNSEKFPSVIALSKLVLDLKPKRDVIKKYNHVFAGMSTLILLQLK